MQFLPRKASNVYNFSEQKYPKYRRLNRIYNKSPNRFPEGSKTNQMFPKLCYLV